MDAIFEWVYIIAGINLLYVLFARAVSFILGLFIQKFRFFLASVFATWIVIILLIFLLRNSTIFNSFFAYILFPSICMLILYFLGKLSNTSFSRGEYIYFYSVYTVAICSFIRHRIYFFRQMNVFIQYVIKHIETYIFCLPGSFLMPQRIGKKREKQGSASSGRYFQWELQTKAAQARSKRIQNTGSSTCPAQRGSLHGFCHSLYSS